MVLAECSAVWHLQTMAILVSVEELHALTAEFVRRAAASTERMMITDRGRVVAVLANPNLLVPSRRKRVLLPEYEAMMRRDPGSDLPQDLDAIRGSR